MVVYTIHPILAARDYADHAQEQAKHEDETYDQK